MAKVTIIYCRKQEFKEQVDIPDELVNEEDAFALDDYITENFLPSDCTLEQAVDETGYTLLRWED